MSFSFKELKNRTRPYFIAEAGVNHEGSITKAKKMIDVAKKAGADAIKFQTYKASKIASKNSPYYWDIKKEKTRSQYELFSKFDKFNFKEYKILSNYCKKKKIEFLSTPFDLNAVNFLNPLVNLFKISSSDITNFPLIEKIASKKKPVILSTGASNTSEIKDALRIINKKTKKVVLMHCILNYPTENKNANLNMIRFLKEKFPKCIIGYSDHTLPSKEMTNLVSSYLLGAKVIEKHFTLNKKIKGNDHYHSVDKRDIVKFLDKINEIHPTLGNYKKNFIKSEIKSRKNARRSLVTTGNFFKGHKLRLMDLIAKRPASGISPIYLKKVLGRKLKKNLLDDTILKWKHLY
tara:strand:+ start:1081 stop:2124 length:1044 start_codon:yes stop_codon:yes gene_type:complete